MRKKLSVILSTALLFLSIVISGIATVYRVDGVSVSASLVTEEAKIEAEVLKTRLENAYKKENIFSVEEKVAEEIIKEFPYFHMTGFRKEFPNKIVIEIAEDIEIYAAESNGGYYLLGEDGTVLDFRGDYTSRLSGENTILFKGMTINGVNGEVPTGDDCFPTVMEVCGKISALLGGIRGNVTSVEVFSRSPETIFVLTMREGVRIYIGNAKELTLEKTERAIREYTSLANAQKLAGRLIISDAGGVIYSNYAAKDDFIK